MSDPLIREKIRQVPGILAELGLDAWMLFARESSSVHDPSFDLVVGTNVTWHSAFLLTRDGKRIAVIGSLDAANVKAHGMGSLNTPGTALAAPTRIRRTSIGAAW